MHEAYRPSERIVAHLYSFDRYNRRRVAFIPALEMRALRPDQSIVPEPHRHNP
jgi:hypothetical protein